MVVMMCTSTTMVGSLIVDGEMESGVRVRDGSEVSSPVVAVASLCSAWIKSKVLSEADSKLLAELRVLSLSSSMSNATLACNGHHLYCVQCDFGKGCQMAKFDPFLSLDCARVEGVGAQSKRSVA